MHECIVLGRMTCDAVNAIQSDVTGRLMANENTSNSSHLKVDGSGLRRLIGRKGDISAKCDECDRILVQLCYKSGQLVAPPR